MPGVPSSNGDANKTTKTRQSVQSLSLRQNSGEGDIPALSAQDLARHEKAEALRNTQDRGYANIELGWAVHNVVNTSNVRTWRKSIVPGTPARQPHHNPISSTPPTYDEVAVPTLNETDPDTIQWFEANDKRNFMLRAPPPLAGVVTATIKTEGDRVVMRLASNKSFLAHSWTSEAVCCSSGGNAQMISIGPEDMTSPQFVKFKVFAQGAGVFSGASTADIRSDHDNFGSTLIAIPKTSGTITVPDADSVAARLGFDTSPEGSVKTFRQAAARGARTTLTRVHGSTEPIQEATSSGTLSNAAPKGATLTLTSKTAPGAPCLVVYPHPDEVGVQYIAFRGPLTGCEAFSIYLGYTMLAGV